MRSTKESPLILIVDDDEAIRLLLEEAFLGEGYRVLSASDGLAALSTVRESRPNLVTLDIKMPGMDGLEALRRIKREYPNVLVVMLTAFGSFRDDHDTELADAYEVKSADLTGLMKTVKRLLHSR